MNIHEQCFCIGTSPYDGVIPTRPTEATKAQCAVIFAGCKSLQHAQNFQMHCAGNMYNRQSKLELQSLARSNAAHNVLR